jgi:hypothetical protein
MRHFHISLKDDQGDEIDHPVPVWRFLIEPIQLGKTEENICYFGFFKSNNNQASNLIVGTEFFKEYYMMFDGTPHQVGRQAYIQVGISERNKGVDVGQIRYEPSYKDYMRANKENDVSTINVGYTDQYDVAIKTDDNIKPTFGGDPDHPVMPEN